MTLTTFNICLAAMTAIAVVVFAALFKVDAGYGKFYDKKWGPAINNRLGWVLMESPVFIAMILLWVFSGYGPKASAEATAEAAANGRAIARLILLLIFELHYFQRSFIFPMLIRGKSKMPLSIIVMGITFNTLNALMQGGWIFYISAPERYTAAWLCSPQFIIGTVIFVAGMFINIQSDAIIRHLRKPGETAHHLPQGGMFRYVSSANYFGELLEWVGFAVLTWSLSGAVFAIWTFANLGPRAARIHQRYQQEFGEAFDGKRIKRIIPFIY